MRIYPDASPVICVVQGVAPFFDYVDERLSVPGDTLVISPLTMLECRVKPI